MIRALVNATLFPYTTLFRSPAHDLFVRAGLKVGDLGGGEEAALTDELGHGAGAIGLRLAPEAGDLDEPSSRSEEHTFELQSRENLVCRLLLEKKKVRRGRSE